MEEQRLHLDEINLRSVFKDLLRNWWVVVLLVASVYLAVSAYEKMSFTPQYTSKAIFVVSARGNTSAYSSLSLTNNMAGVFSEVFKSNILREKVEAKMDGKKLDGEIFTDIIEQTNLMVVSVVSSSPEQSFLALKTVIETYPEISDYMFDNAVLEVIKKPQVAMVPSNSFDSEGYMRVGLLAALVLGVGGVAALSILRTTVQTPMAARRRLDGRQLRTVRHEKRKTPRGIFKKKKNIAPLITNPLISTGFREDNQSLCSKVEYHMRKRDQKIIMVCSAGENEGKSTVAANLALGLAAKNKRVALLDCDFRKSAVHKIFEVKPEEARDFGHFLSSENAGPDFLVPLKKHGIFVGVNRSGYKYPQRLITSHKMEEYLLFLREQMDYIILDTPPMMVAADTEALGQYADTAVLVVREDCIGIRDVNDCMDSLRRCTGDLAGYVLNNSHDRWLGVVNKA